LKGEGMASGPHLGKTWRHAHDGWFSYEVKVLPDAPMELLCTYWGSDVNRAFDVLVNGTKVATQRLDNDKPGEFIDVAYPLPRKMTQGKTSINVTFKAHPGNTAGGVFGLRILRAKE
jgi:uncharacterized protein